MMIKYIDGAILEGIEKSKALKGKIPRARDLGIHFSPLATIATTELDSLIESFELILNDTNYSSMEVIQQKFTYFKQISGRLSEVENVLIAAISRKTSDDEFVNKLVYGICSEINYPLAAPVASCLSQKYYHIYPYYNLICIPLLESEFVLHIPDLYHELGHPLISIDNPKLTEFQKCLGLFNIEVKKYFNEEIERRELNSLSSGDDSPYNPLHIWRDSWIENWSTELFCDLFAVYTLGPAYAWSNIHMCAKMSWDIYRISMFQKTSHPPDDARMKAIMFGLQNLKFTDQTTLIGEKWSEFKHIVNKKPMEEYSIAFPDSLLKRAADLCLEGTKSIGCSIVTPDSKEKFYSLLNDSWGTFWNSPIDFHKWERENFRKFRETL